MEVCYNGRKRDKIPVPVRTGIPIKEEQLWQRKKSLSEYGEPGRTT